jgi:hypothetical protein
MDSPWLSSHGNKAEHKLVRDLDVGETRRSGTEETVCRQEDSLEEEGFTVEYVLCHARSRLQARDLQGSCFWWR